MNKQIYIDHKFEQIGIRSFITKILAINQFQYPTPIQYYSIKTAIQNQKESLICKSKSGTGKTLAYVVLILENIANLSVVQDKTYNLIIVPTRQLAIQVYQNIKKILQKIKQINEKNEQQKKLKDKLKNLNIILTIGGLDFKQDCKKYNEKHSHIVVSSVGRLWELLKNKVMVFGQKMELVLDQGDKLFGSKDDKFRQILQILPKESRWFVFSATYSKNILQELSRYKKFIYVQTMLKNNELEVIVTNRIEQQLHKNDQLNEKNELQVSQITQNIHLQNIKKYKVQLKKSENLSIFELKIQKLKQILTQLSYKKCLLFTQKKSFLQQISQNLTNISHILIHGSLSQASRFRMMNKINQTKLIISSDLLSRGIDIKLDLVILFDAKKTDTFWHRIGRTGRYGRTGVVISLDQVIDDDWHIYDKDQINNILQSIEMQQKKIWFGAHLSQMGKWHEFDEQKQALNNYRYFEQLPQEQTIKKSTMIDQQQQHNKNILIKLSKIKNENQLKLFIQQNVIKCTSCQQLIKQTTQLTGYQFQIVSFGKQF